MKSGYETENGGSNRRAVVPQLSLDQLRSKGLDSVPGVGISSEVAALMHQADVESARADTDRYAASDMRPHEHS